MQGHLCIAGLLKNGVNLPQIQPVKPPIQHQKPHAEHLNGISHAQKTSGPYAKQPKAHTSHAAGPNAKVPLQQPLNQPKHSVVNGTHPQTDPKLPPAEHPKQASQNAPPGTSLQSAQTALPQKPLKAKHAKGPAPAASSTLSEEVVQQVCAAARIGQKETLLVALLQCKPCKNQVQRLLHGRPTCCSVQQSALKVQWGSCYADQAVAAAAVPGAQ